jgi:exodeoxyribonuclease VII small subunit
MMATVKSLSFEQAIKELEEIITELESGNLPLEKTLSSFEKGMLLAQHCSKLLDTADLKVQQLSGGADSFQLAEFKED